jgi:MraZ protein
VNFTGEYHNTIDPKGRASIPARFRELLAQQGEERLVVTKNLEGGLTAYPLAMWNEVQENVRKSPNSPLKTAMTRHMISPAEECGFDKQGRIQVPQSLRTYAGLEKDIVVVGLFEKIEIFSQAKFDEVTLRSAELLQGDPQAVADMGF